MSYKKFLKSVDTVAHLGVTGNSQSNGVSGLYNKYKNYLPFVYQGPANRIERYAIYDGMEQDPIISWSLDIISDFVSQSDDKEPFKIEYETFSELPSSQTQTIEKALDNWVKINSWKKRTFALIREVLKYGDVIFIRDPETNVLNKVNIYDVVGVVVDEYKKPTHYLIRNVDLNIPLKMANNAKDDVETKNLLNTLNGNFSNTINNSTTQITNNQTNDMSILPVKAEDIVHLSLNIDNILLYPFGLSTLEAIYKIYVQKMLLQDCILLYRIKNATEKLVFSIPVGNVPRYKRKQFLEKCKNELSQRRMPSKDSDGVFNTIDVAYNSIPMNEDFWLPVDADGIQPKIEKLQGGQALGEINDMVYWENQLIRGLKVPQSWIPYGPTDGQRTVPGANANVFVQELRFFKYCVRLQQILIENLDKEFKYFLKKQGIMVDEDSFKLSYFEPTNITEVTRMNVKQTQLNLFSTASGSPFISKQFALKNYLGLTEEEYNENQRLLMLEMQNTLKNKDVKLPTEDPRQVPGLRTVGVEDIPMDYLNNMSDQLEMGANNMNAGMGGAGLGGMGGLEGSEFGGNEMGSEVGGLGQAPSGLSGGIEGSSQGNTGNGGV